MKQAIIITLLVALCGAAFAQKTQNTQKIHSAPIEVVEHPVQILGNTLTVETPTDFFYPVYFHHVPSGHTWLFQPRGQWEENLVNMPAGLWVIGPGPNYPWFTPFKWYKPF